METETEQEIINDRNLNRRLNLKEEFNKARGDGKPKFGKMAEDYYLEVSKTYCRALIQEGLLVRAKTGIVYYVWNHKVIMVGKGEFSLEFKNFLAVECNFTKSDKNGNKIYDRLVGLVMDSAIEAPLYNLSHYDIERNTLYIRKSTTEWFKLTKDSVEIIKNGDEGIIGLGEFENVEIETNEIKYDPHYLSERIYRRVWFTEETQDFDRAILKFWVQSLFFGELVIARPLLILSGGAGTGKTSVLEAIGKLIFGENFFVNGMTSDERDFISAVMHNQYLAIDNVDEDMPDWFADKLAGIATGMGFKMRRLYTDADIENMTIKPNTFIALTTRTPKFNRDDIADRSIVLNLERKGVFKAFAFQVDRNEGWRYLLADLQQILSNLKVERDSYDLNIRIIQFADFCIKSVRPGYECKVVEIFQDIKERQNVFALEGKPMIDALMHIAENTPGEYSTAALLDLLNNKYAQNLKNTFSMGTIIGKQKDLIKKQIRFDNSKRVDGQTIYIIGDVKEEEDNSEITQELLSL